MSIKLARAQKAVTDWNQKHPVGTPVTRYKLVKPLREPQETKTSSTAWLMCGTPVVSVEGVSGCVSLESLEPKKS